MHCLLSRPQELSLYGTVWWRWRRTTSTFRLADLAIMTPNVLLSTPIPPPHNRTMADAILPQFFSLVGMAFAVGHGDNLLNAVPVDESHQYFWLLHQALADVSVMRSLPSLPRPFLVHWHYRATHTDCSNLTPNSARMSSLAPSRPSTVICEDKSPPSSHRS